MQIKDKVMLHSKRLKYFEFKFVNMLEKKQYSQLKQLLDLYKSEISDFPAEDISFIVNWCVVLTSDPEHIRFICNHVPNSIIIDALYKDDYKILKNFVHCNSELDRLIQKPNFDYRAVRKEKLLALLELNKTQVVKIIEGCAMGSMDEDVYMSKEFKEDFINIMRAYSPTNQYELPKKRSADIVDCIDFKEKKRFKSHGILL